MKLIMLIFYTFLSFLTFAQLPTNENGEIVFSAVVQSEGVTKEELYKKAKFWIVSTLKSGDNMVELDGDNSDQIIGTGNIPLYNIVLDGPFEAVQNSLNFKFIVFCKDDRFKYEISNFTYNYLAQLNGVPQENVSGNLDSISKPKNFDRWTKEKYALAFEKSIKDEVQLQVESLIQNFLDSMKDSDSNDDW